MQNAECRMQMNNVYPLHPALRQSTFESTEPMRRHGLLKLTFLQFQSNPACSSAAAASLHPLSTSQAE
eukprot:4653778-Pleurochrysis_carterae.AAC.1